MMNVNQSVLASAVINITGNTRGLEQALGQTRKQMQGFLVFANAIGGKTGGLLANGLAMGGAGPILKTVLGSKLGGKASGFLDRAGLTSDPMDDIDKAMDRAKREFRRATYLHRMRGAGIGIGNYFQGQRLNTPLDVKRARVQHSMDSPKMEDFTQKYVAGAAQKAQELALFFGKLGLAVRVSIDVFGKLAASGMELEKHMLRATRVFGSSLGSATAGFGFGSNMSQSQYLAGASGIGQELTGSGVGRAQSSRMSSSLTQRAGQVAAAWGDQFEDVAGSIQSALAGSNTALKKFGVILSDDLVRANAFNSGMIKYLEVMSASVAAQSRYNLIMAQTNDVAEKGVAGFFSLSNQWTLMTSGLSTIMQQLGSLVAPVAAGLLLLANGLVQLQVAINNFIFNTIGGAFQAVKGAMGFGGNANNAGIDKHTLLAQANEDAKRADQAINRERARQSSNVGFHRPEDFYNHIQKGVFGDPVEFQKRQTDLMHEFVIISKEQLAVMRDFGFKVKDGSALLQP